jgi:hypothetical protein
VLVFSVIMITSFVQVMLEAFQRLLSPDHSVIEMLALSVSKELCAGRVLTTLQWLACHLHYDRHHRSERNLLVVVPAGEKLQCSGFVGPSADRWESVYSCTRFLGPRMRQLVCFTDDYYSNRPAH